MVKSYLAIVGNDNAFTCCQSIIFNNIRRTKGIERFFNLALFCAGEAARSWNTSITHDTFCKIF